MRVVDQLLWAEALAYPFASVEALEAELIELDCNAWGFPARCTKRLSDDFDRHAQCLFNGSGLTLEFIRSVRTHAWFDDDGNGGHPLRMDEYAKKLAKSLLNVNGQRIVLEARLPEPTKSCRHVSDLLEGGSDFWQRLGTRICTDLLMATGVIDIDGGKHLLSQGRVAIANDQIGHRLPLVDQHLHLGACLPLSVLWAQALTARVLRPPLTNERDDTSDVFQFAALGGVLDLRPLLFRAAVGRIALVWFLVERKRNRISSGRQFGEWLADKGVRISQDDANADFLWRVLRATGTWRNGVAQGRSDYRYWRNHVRRWNRGLRYLENQLSTELEQVPSRTLAADPISSVWGSRIHVDASATIELELIHAALEYIVRRSSKVRDAEFETLFWQLVRVKNLFHQHLTQQEGVAGLTFFDHYYRRMSRFRSSLRQSQLSIAEDHLNLDGNVRKLEFRIAPGRDLRDTRSDLRVKLRDYDRLLTRADSARRIPACIGLSIHFVKSWGDTKSNRPHSYPVGGDDPVSSRRRCRYQGYWQGVWRQMENLAHLLSRAPALSFFVRGIDIANRERSIPNWVFCHLFIEFRRLLSPAVIGAVPRRFPMRMTAHLGEEFEHPLTGMRHIWEGVRYFGYERGDRLGHGVALGLPLEQWTEEHSEVWLPVEEYLDDLIWESFVYECAGLPDNGDRVWVDREIERVARALYPDDEPRNVCRHHPLAGTPDGSMLRTAYRFRFESDNLLEVGVLVNDPQTKNVKIPRIMRVLEPSTSTLKLVFAQLFCERLWKHSQNIGNWRVRIDDCYLRRARRIQNWLCQWVGTRGIVVEACPSSNRLIGDLGWYENHPVFQFAPPSDPGSARVAFTVNSDDPLTFNTRIADELQHLFRSMTERLNIPAPVAERWIRERCETAWDTSFVVGAPRSPEQQPEIDQIRLAIQRAYAQLSPYT